MVADPLTTLSPSLGRGPQPSRFAVVGWDGHPPKISAVVCAYNEADRIRGILDAVHNHPALVELIVVNDGSTDETDALLADYPDIQVISYTPNRGKTYALARGAAAAKGDYLMLLDADLEGVTAADIQALADPVISGRSQVSISLRSNSLFIYRRIGLDFVSGERVIPASLLKGAVETMEALPRWGGESFINELIVRRRLAIVVVDWAGVLNVRKHRKLGRWRGMAAEFSMVRDALQVLSVWGVLRQNLALLRLVQRRPRWSGPQASGRGVLGHGFGKTPSDQPIEN